MYMYVCMACDRHKVVDTDCTFGRGEMWGEVATRRIAKPPKFPLTIHQSFLRSPRNQSSVTRVSIFEAMESDREQADLGPCIAADLNEESAPVPRQPKKRFIGRRAATERAAAKGEANGAGGIEDSGAVQGAATS